MKGTFFQKGTEYKLEIDGESWAQGDTIKGKLIAKSHSNGPIPEVQALLAYADLKHVHAKKPDSFEVLATTPLKLKDGIADWEFPLDRNAPITDVSSSLFILYGPVDPDPMTLGRLQLSVKPYGCIEKYLDVLRVHFRFVLKFTKAEKKGMQAKLVPPDGAKNLSFLEHVLIRFSFNGDDLHLTYEFVLHTFEANISSVTSKKKKRKREVAFTAAQYRTPSGRWNDDFFQSEIAAALQELDQNRGT